MIKLTYSIVFTLLFFANSCFAETFLYFNSQQGDYIGGGKTQTWTPTQGTFTATGVEGSNIVSISFNGGTDWWYLYFAAPSNQQLQVGSYENATRYPFQSPTGPGLSISGNGRGCNTLTGRFDILEISYINGQISSFAADFEQHCEGGDPALFGSIRYNATVGFPLSVNLQANGSNTPISVSVGETVDILVQTEAGDDTGTNAEYWLARSGPYGTQWFNAGIWKISKNNIPLLWKKQPIDSNSYNIQWIPELPGVYMFQFIVDNNVQNKSILDIYKVDHVVITVK